MLPVPSAVLPEPPLAAKPQLREKPHQGVPSKNPVLRQGPSVCKFTVTLGLLATVVENGVRETYSARYYNPATDRFLSRDPEGSFLFDPASFHKYLYADGNPVNEFDPSGRAALLEYKLLRKIIAGTGLQAHHLIEKRFLFILDFTGCELSMAVTPDEHQVITNAWRAAIPYGPNGTYCATAAEVLSTAQAIYSDAIYAAILARLAVD